MRTAGYETHGQMAVYGPDGKDIAIVYDGAANGPLIRSAPRLLEALRRIADHESRADRRHRGMVDMSELQDLQRVARSAIAEATEEV
jgi:hypothetical protein